MIQEKNPADTKELDEKWEFEYELKSPLNDIKRNVIDPHKSLGPQNLNSTLRENVKLIVILFSRESMRSW